MTDHDDMALHSAKKTRRVIARRKTRDRVTKVRVNGAGVRVPEDCDLVSLTLAEGATVGYLHWRRRRESA